MHELLQLLLGFRLAAIGLRRHGAPSLCWPGQAVFLGKRHNFGHKPISLQCILQHSTTQRTEQPLDGLDCHRLRPCLFNGTGSGSFPRKHAW